MNIRRKAVISVLVITASLLAVLHLTARHLFMERFASLEQNAIVTDLKRVDNAINEFLAQRAILAKAMATREETVQYASGLRPGRLSTDWNPAILRQQGVDFIAIIDRSEKIVFAAEIDATPALRNAADTVLHDLQQQRAFVFAATQDFSTQGFLPIAGRAMLIGSRAIAGDEPGQVVGTMIVGTWFSPALQHNIQTITELNVSFGPADRNQTGQNAPVIDMQQRTIAASRTLTDLAGNPILTVSVSSDRSIMRAGLTSIHAHLAALFLFGGAFTLLAIYTLDRHVLSRLAVLTAQITDLSARPDGLVTEDGADELGTLQHTINLLLTGMRSSTASYETLFTYSGTANVVVSTSGIIELANTEFERLCGRSRHSLIQKADITEMLVDPVDADTPLLRQALREEVGMTVEFVLRCDKGDFPVLVTLSPLPKTGRTLLALLNISTLKATQKKMQALSRELEDKVKERTRSLTKVNERLEEEIERSERTSQILGVLNDVSLALSLANETAEAADHLLQILCKLPPIDCGAMYAQSRDGDGFDLIATSCVADDGYALMPHLLPDVPLTTMARRNIAIFRKRTDADICEIELCADPGILAMGMIPISYDETVIAILLIGSRTSHEFPDTLQHIMNTIAVQTGGAIVRIRAQEQSERAAKEMAAIFENSAVGIMHIGPRRKILKANQCLADMFGYNIHELIGQHVSMLHESEEASEEFARTHYPDLHDRSQTLRFEHRMKTRSGELRWFSFSGRMIDLNDHQHGFVWVLEDIQEEKESSEELTRFMNELQEARDLQEENSANLVAMVAELEHAKDEAESASRMKSDFLANVSHEIRTPMNAIMGMTDIALESATNPDQRRSLNIVKNSAEGLLDLINGILDLSKIEAGQFELEIRPFQIRKMIESAITTLGLTAGSKGLDLICQLPMDLPAEMSGDPARIRQILINLMGNAVKFTPSGHVRCLLTLDGEDEEGFLLHFAVEDTGIGIPEAKKQSIFEDFTQVDSSSTRVYGGTGLGLSISRKLVSLMQGDIWVESTQGQGSTFHFTARLGKVCEHDRSGAGIFGSNIKALVVVNNPHINAQVTESLSYWGITPISTTCYDIQDSSLPVDLAILDTDFNDYDCLDLISPDGKLHATTTILLTLYSDKQAIAQTPMIKSILTKPLMQDDLLRALSHALKIRIDLPEAMSMQNTVPNMPPLNILLVEDVPTNRELAEILLKKLGHTVHDARDGLDALTVLSRRAFDLVLMDLQMPVMDGFLATQILRACERNEPSPSNMDESFLVRELRDKVQGTHTPVIAMTAHAMLQDRQRCEKIGMDGYLTKPFRKEEVISTLSTIAGNLYPNHAPAPDLPDEQRSSAPEDSDSPQIEQPAMTEVADSGYVDRMIAGLAEKYDLDREQSEGLIENLAETLPGHLEGLQTALRSGSTEELRHHAHSIKGLLLNMDLTSEGMAAKELEDLSRNEESAEVLAPATDLLLRIGAAILHDIDTNLSPHA